MGRVRRIPRSGVVLLLAAACVSVCGGSAVASDGGGWPLDGPAGVLLAFGERYTAADGSQATHRGVDLEASAGSSVHATLAGTVSFAGRVPAGEGATTLAVTVQTGDLRVTVMPLSEISVESGELVAQGDVLGAVAGSGDRSHSAAHLHVGVRRGDLYVDPMSILVAPAAAVPVEELAEEVPDSAPVREPAPATATGSAPSVAVPSGAGAGMPATSAQGSTVSGSVSQPAPASQAAPVGAGSVAPVTGAEGLSAPTATRAAGSEVPGGTPVLAGDGAPATMPASLRGAAAALDLDPDQVGAALATDRRASLRAAGPATRGALLGVAALAAVLLLSPVWLSTPVPRLHVGPISEDVAAVVSR